MFKLERLCLAMVEHEGWNPHRSTNLPNGSRSFRNHNPGNLRSSPFQAGVRDGFAYFKTDLDGFMAMKYDITQKARGNTRTGLNGNSSIKDLIRVWAPPSDNNDTSAYLHNVLAMTGFSENMKLRDLLE